MKFTEVEDLLRRQRIHPLPDEWRSEILAAAQVVHERTVPVVPPSTPSVLTWLREHLSPSPLAWGVLACAVFVGCLVGAALLMPHFASATVVTSNDPSAAPLNVIVEAVRERRELARLNDPEIVPLKAHKPKTPGPSSERRIELFDV